MADAMDLLTVKQFFEKHKQEIIQRYQAIGAGIGRPDPQGSYVIVVYVESQSAVPPERLVMEGVPIRFEVTGKFFPLK